EAERLEDVLLRRVDVEPLAFLGHELDEPERLRGLEVRKQIPGPPLSHHGNEMVFSQHQACPFSCPNWNGGASWKRAMRPWARACSAACRRTVMSIMWTWASCPSRSDCRIWRG